MQLVFFLPALKLSMEIVNATPAGDTEGADAASREQQQVLLASETLKTPVRVLAWHLLAAGPPSADKCWQRTHWRLVQARTAILHAESLEQSGEYSRAREAFRLGRGLWSWLSRSRAMRRWLFEHARLIGYIDRADALVKEVLGAVETELLPLLHLKWLLVQLSRGHKRHAGSVKFHARNLDRWPVPEHPGEVLLYWYGIYLRLRHRLAMPLTPRLEREICKWLQAPGIPKSIAAQILRAFALLLDLHFKRWLDADTVAEVMEKRIIALHRLLGIAPPHLHECVLSHTQVDRAELRPLAPDLPPSLPIFALASRLYMQLALRGIRSRHLSFQYGFESELARLYFDPDGKVACQIAKNPLLGSLQLTREFLATDDGQRLQAQLREAQLGELAFRLEIDLHEPSERAELERFVGAIESLQALWPKVAESVGNFAGFAREWLQDKVPEFFARFGRRLREPLQRPVASILMLIERIKLPDPPDVEAMGAVSEAITVADTPVPASGTAHVALWALSPTDLVFKLAAVGGLCLLLFSAVELVRSMVAESTAERSYLQLVRGIEHAGDPIVLSRAAAFLRAEANPDTPRSRQARLILQEALFREAPRLREQGQSAAAEALLRDFGPLLAEPALPPGEELAQSESAEEPEAPQEPAKSGMAEATP